MQLSSAGTAKLLNLILIPKQINKNLAKNRVIIVTVKNRIKVDETFGANETSIYNSSTVATKKLQIWRPENNTKPSRFAEAIERVVNLLFSSDCETCRVFREIKADCNLTLTPSLVKMKPAVIQQYCSMLLEVISGILKLILTV